LPCELEKGEKKAPTGTDEGREAILLYSGQKEGALQLRRLCVNHTGGGTRKTEARPSGHRRR